MVYQQRQRSGFPWLPVILGCLGVVALLVIGVGLFVWRIMGEMADVDVAVNVEVPAEVIVGEEFEIAVHIKPRNFDRLELHSIDFGPEYMEGIAIRSSDPPYASSDLFFDSTSYEFGQEIPVAEGLWVRFRAQALEPGDYHGDLMIWFATSFDSVDRTIRTVVRPREG
ncbi:MAG: hypothetical protein IH851_09000 [Armatimonadetes bacterium]|nr:hypothetical protein [Armatimonadota bacterium]